MSKGLQIAIAAVSVFAGIAWILASSTAGEGTFSYYETVSAYAAAAPNSDPESQRGTRVHGLVRAGSIDKNLAAGYVAFAIADDAESSDVLLVRYAGIDVPDLFGDGAEVVVEGRYDGKTFHADRVLAKCPSKYEAKSEVEA